MLFRLLRFVAGFTLMLFTVRRWVFLWVAWLRPRRSSRSEVGPLPNVLVVVPFHNERSTLPDCLAAIRRLDYPAQQLTVLLVDDGSTDDCGRIAQPFISSHPHWATLRLSTNVGKAAALNEAIRRYPQATYLVVYDADERPQPDSLRHLASGFGDERVGGVTGRRVVGNGLASAAATYATYENLVHQHITCQAKDTLHLFPPLLGSNCAYRRTALTDVGGFRPGMALEDSDLTVRLARAGWQTRYLPQAISYTKAPETLAGYVAQHRRWAQGFGDVVGEELRVPSSRFQVSGLGVRGMFEQLELFLFATGYLDRVALAALLGDWFLQRLTHLSPELCRRDAPRTTSPFLLLTLLTPFLQLITALWLEKSAAAYWHRLVLLPFFFLLDILTASLGIGQSVLGIMRGSKRLRDFLSKTWTGV